MQSSGRERLASVHLSVTVDGVSPRRNERELGAGAGPRRSASPGVELHALLRIDNPSPALWPEAESGWCPP
jgi:uncharacterized protein (DUF58 family)